MRSLRIQKGRRLFNSIQHLRGLAATLVLIHHAIHKQGQISGTGGAWDFGISGVDLFFIISGFIMCHVTATRETRPSDFLMARVRRIIPLYWALSLVALAVYVVKPSLVNSSGGSTSLIGSFTLVPTGDKFLIQNGWTLSYEFLFYLVFALVLWAKTRYRLSAVVYLLITLVTAGALLSPTQPTVAFATNPILLEFVMGIAAYAYIASGAKPPVVNATALAIGVAGLIYASTVPVGDYRSLYYGLPFALVFIALVGSETLISRFSNTAISRLSTSIGDASYSIYLSHPFVLAGLGNIFKKLHLSPMLAVALMTVIALAAGYFCHITLEKKLTALFGKPARSSNTSSSKVTHTDGAA